MGYRRPLQRPAPGSRPVVRWDHVAHHHVTDGVRWRAGTLQRTATGGGGKGDQVDVLECTTKGANRRAHCTDNHDFTFSHEFLSAAKFGACRGCRHGESLDPSDLMQENNTQQRRRIVRFCRTERSARSDDQQAGARGAMASLAISPLCACLAAFSDRLRALMVATHWSSLLRMTMHSKHWMHSS